MYPMTAGYPYYPNPAMGMNGMMADTTSANPYYYGGNIDQQRTEGNDANQNANDQSNKRSSLNTGSNVSGMMSNNVNNTPPTTNGYEQYNRSAGYSYDQYYNGGHYFG